VANRRATTAQPAANPTQVQCAPLMVRGSILFAMFGLVLNAFLWSVPALVAASGAAQIALGDRAVSLAETLSRVSRQAGETPKLQDALLGLIGAEAEALEVAGVAIQNPHTPDLAARANEAGARVLEATQTYVRSAQAALD
jgi:hypothetical protein